jgi:hypothetical protein
MIKSRLTEGAGECYRCKQTIYNTGPKPLGCIKYEEIDEKNYCLKCGKKTRENSRKEGQ